jgi:hypothetical protein
LWAIKKPTEGWLKARTYVPLKVVTYGTIGLTHTEPYVSLKDVVETLVRETKGTHHARIERVEYWTPKASIYDNP